MSINLGMVKPGSLIQIPFNTFDSNDPSASVAIAALVAGDIEVYKDGGTTQRASDSGYTLLDTDGIDFDSHVGIGGFSIDLADNSTAGFWASGSRYFVVLGPVTVDAAVVNFIAATFEIGYPDAILNTTIASLTSAIQFILTDGPAEADVFIGSTLILHDVASKVQLAFGVVSDYIVATKEVFLAVTPVGFTPAATDNVAIFIPINVAAWLGTVPATPTVAGVPEVDITHQGGGAIPSPAVTGVPDVNLTHHVDVAASVTNSELDVNVGQIIGTAPSLTGGEIDVNVKTEDNIDFGATKKASINTEVDTAISDASLATAADLLDKLGAVNEAAAAGDPSATESVMQYVKQIINILVGTAGVVTFPAAAAPGNAVSLAEIIRAIYDDSNSLDGTKIPDTLSLANINAEVDTAFTTQMPDSVSSDGTIATREQAIYMILQMLTEFAISGTTMTVKKVDGSTTLITLTLDDATSPTSLTRAT